MQDLKPQKPITVRDFLNNADGAATSSPFTTDITTPEEDTTFGHFNPHQYKHLKNASSQDDPETLRRLDAASQSKLEKLWYAGKQFGANFISSFGQGLANTFDLASNYESIKSMVQGKGDDYVSHLFGLSTRDMQDWANGVAQRNQVLEKDPNGFNPGDFGWWAKQFASSGTGVGMAVDALAETALIEWATGGVGTGAALTKIGNTLKNLRKAKNGMEIAKDAFEATKGLKSAATVYGVMSRVSESRMEAQNTYDQIYKELSQETTDDGSPKYTEDQKKEFAGRGAARDYYYNLALLPLDILSYRTMVFNPISGTEEGVIEKGLEKVAGVFGKSAIGKKLGWAASKGIGVQLEGIEEGFQQIGQNEGEHFGKVLAGEDDHKGYRQRLAETVGSDDFWNNYAGGIIGVPIIGGAMNIVNQTIHGRAKARQAQVHKDFIANIGSMSSDAALDIKTAQEAGFTDKAQVLRRQFSASQTIGALHLDAVNDSNKAYDKKLTVMKGILEELEQGKTTALEDLGFFDFKPEHLEKVKTEFANYVKDAEELKGIYDSVKNRYNKNFVPQITQQHYDLNRLQEKSIENDMDYLREQAKIPQYDQLSTNGKYIHDAEYQLQALKFQEAALTQMHTGRRDDQEKENINAALERNRAKQTEISDKLKEIGEQGTYSEREKDNEILDGLSTLLSVPYQKAAWQKEQFADELTIGRKSLALWNNEKYKRKRFDKILKNATNIEQVDNLKEDADPVSTKAATDAEDRINAAEAAKTQNLPVGNAPFFTPEDHKNADALKEMVTSTLVATPPPGVVSIDANDDEYGQNGEPISLSLSPVVFDFENSAQEYKDQIKTGVEGMLNTLGNTNETSFEEVVRYAVKLNGREAADKLYNALKYGWEANNRDAVDYNAVYDKIFGNPMDLIMKAASQLNIPDEKALDIANDETQSTIISDQKQPEDFDSNNKPVRKYSGRVTHESSPKMAYTSRPVESTSEVNPDGSINVNYKYTGQIGDSNNKWVDSTPLLDYDLQAGAETTISIPDDFNDVIVPVFGEDGKYQKFIPFGQYVAERGLKLEDQEYRDKIPMIHYLKGVENGGKGVANVHDIGWYHPNRFDETKPEEMQKAIENTRAIREEVLASPTKSTEGVITGVRQTTFEGLKTNDENGYNNIKLRDADPTTTLAMVANNTDSKSVYTSVKDKGVKFEDGTRVLVNKKNFKGINEVVEVRRYGTNEDGLPTYVANYVLQRKLDLAAKESVMYAIYIYGNRSITETNLRVHHDKAAKHILDTMGLDIKTAAGLEKYLSHFIYVFNTGVKGDSTTNLNTIVETAAKNKQAFGTPYIALQNNQVIFGLAGKPLYIDTTLKEQALKSGKTEDEANQMAARNSLFINPGSTRGVNKEVVKWLKSDEVLGWFRQNLNLDNYNADKAKPTPVVTINKDGETKVSAPSYNDFLLDRFETNLKSINIGTKEKPKYANNIQPIITYDTKTRLSKLSEQDSLENIAKEIDTKTETKTEEIPSKESGVETEVDILARELAKADKRLGNYDRGTNAAEYSMSPTILAENQTQEVAKSVKRIAGLTPQQQEHLTDFMFNQIVLEIELNGGTVTKAQVDAKVDEAVKAILNPTLEEDKAEVARLEPLIASSKALKNSRLPQDVQDYKNRIAKIEAIYDNLDTLKEIAYTQVQKYTKIQISREDTEADTKNEEGEGNDDVVYDNEGNQKEVDFWTDVLTESPDSRATYRMRRFFGQIRKYSKDASGNVVPEHGFFGLPLYEKSDAAIRLLMTNLVDVPSSFDAMIGKLETLRASVPWMGEAIDKLKNTDKTMKNTFVTVMTKTSLRMKFAMISYNRRNGTWSTKVFDTNLGGISDAVKTEWINNLETDTTLIQYDDNSNMYINKEKADALIDQFKRWKGLYVETMDTRLVASLWEQGVKEVTSNVQMTITPKDAQLTSELNSKLKNNEDRVYFTLKGQKFQAKKAGENKFKISTRPEASVPATEIAGWLKEFGITLSKETLAELMKSGMYHNYAQRKYRDLFDTGEDGKVKETNGLFGILYNKLVNAVNRPDTVYITEEGGSPLEDSVINSLATLEAKYNNTVTPFGFRDGQKSLFAITMPKFATDRTKELKDVEDDLRDQLEQVSFSKHSLWLNLLKRTPKQKANISRLRNLMAKETDADKLHELEVELADVLQSNFRDKFQIAHLGLTAIQQQGKRIYRDNSIGRLSSLDHELCKLSMFWDTKQGAVSYTFENAKGETIQSSTYPDTRIGMRMATVFSPTMSDKNMMTMVKTAVLNLTTKELNKGQGISDEVVTAIRDQCVRPELDRMIKFYQNGGSTNIDAYDKGAGLFLMLPELNSVMFSPELSLRAAIKEQANTFSLDVIEGNDYIKKQIDTIIRGYADKLANDKVQSWYNLGLVSEVQDNATGEISTQANFFDDKYFTGSRFDGTVDEKIKMAAYDFVINSMIANANSFMLYTGDPAQYFKSKSDDVMQQTRDTYENIGKRLANLIAPGTTIAESDKEEYIQLFIQDRESVAENIDYLERLLGVEGAKSYRKINAADAQEYTTWKEHLSILSRLGKTSDNLIDITQEEIDKAEELFSKGTPLKDLDQTQRELIAKIMQPIKPVYTGQTLDANQDVMRTVYIKSSSFPLIPQLTKDFQIDKLRLAMEKVQKNTGKNVRASHQTANKVGSVSNAAEIWNKDGTINDEILAKIGDSSLVLQRKNFRIQQDVPYKADKTTQDKVTLGTQLMKLLFGNEIMSFDGYMYDGKSIKGVDLYKEYNTAFINLIQEKQNQLYLELGLDDNGIPKDVTETRKKLQEVLRKEAEKRGYPLQDIEGLKLVDVKDNSGRVIGSEFNLPLWASTNSNRFESLLNSIVTNRMVRIKMPGTSMVVGSSEGFIAKKELSQLSKEQRGRVIHTSAFNGSHLTSLSEKDGKLKKAQVFLPSRFRNNQGELIDLFEVDKNGKYKWIIEKDGQFKLNESKFDSELLSLLTFRIPTSGHQSGSQVEIAGFLPPEVGDFVVVPSNFTKQKGLDFDIDKENLYMLNTILSDGKLRVLGESDRERFLGEANRQLDALRNSDDPENKLLRAFGIFGDDTFTSLDIAESKFKEKLAENQIIQVHHSVYGNPNDEVQKKINRTLNTDFVEAEAKFIEGLKQSKDKDYWTPLSDEYQKGKLMSGANGKIGTGAYSLDVVFHSLANQLSYNNKAINLNGFIGEGKERQAVNIEWNFGTTRVLSTLGRAKTIDGSRDIADVIAERQNMSVDNEKLQVMSKVGVDDETMDVDKVFNMLGVDKGEDGHSVSFLFLSQPIIKRYIELKKNANSSVTEFDEAKMSKILSKINAEFDITDDTTIPPDTELTNANMIKAIQAEKGTTDAGMQALVLDRFMKMDAYGKAIRKIQVAVNFKGNSLGKSVFDVVGKKYALESLGAGIKVSSATESSIGIITGSDKLIGEYIPKEGFSGKSPEGYIDTGNYWIKPTTYIGAMNVKGTMAAYNLWSDYFPYDTANIKAVFDQILPIISNGDNIGTSKEVELKQEVFKHIKKYLASDRHSGIMNSTDDINEERKRLFLDTDTNTSLASYVKQLMKINNPEVNAFIKTNKLLNRIEYDIKKNGQVSKMKFNNAKGEEFDEQYLYESLTNLLIQRDKDGQRIQLPKIGNKEYTVDTLAQDLILYCMIGNSTQEAIQFTKYISTAYFDVTGYSAYMRDRHNKGIVDSRIGEGSEKHLVSGVVMQIIQHSPERVKRKESPESLYAKIAVSNSNDIDKLERFTLTAKDDKPTFISVYNPNIPKGEKKFQLYWLHNGNEYIKIPVLGAFGMDEYQSGEDIGRSIVNGITKVAPAPQAQVNTKQEVKSDSFDINTGDISKVLQAIVNGNMGEVSTLAKALLPHTGTAITSISYGNEAIESTGRVYKNFNGIYNPESGHITISDERMTAFGLSPVQKAETIVHEIVHALTSNKIGPYINTNADGTVDVKNGSPLYASDMVRLYNDVRSRVDTKELQDVLRKIKSDESLSINEFETKYGFHDIYEFMAMATTNAGFQKYLAGEQFKQTDKNLLDKFIDIVTSILKHIGVDFDSNTATAQAIVNTFKVIEAKDDLTKLDDINQQMWDEINNQQDNDYFSRLDDENSEGDTTLSLAPTYPDKKLTFKEENCI